MAGGKAMYLFKFAGKDIETTIHTDNPSHITEISVQVGDAEIQRVNLKVAHYQDQTENKELANAKWEREHCKKLANDKTASTELRRRVYERVGRKKGF